MRIKRFFILYNYISKIKLLRKKIKIKKLEILNINPFKISQVWKIDAAKKIDFSFSNENNYSIFDVKVDLNNINWHEDKVSGFIYPLKRFDYLKPFQFANKDIDMIFPWELSRFYFAINFAKKYMANKDRYYYDKFKSLVLDWIDKNPFLCGINWFTTMDVAIRAANWIVSINYFWDLFEKDDIDFNNKISISLGQHAEYVYLFPLIEKGGLTTNHTISAYAGLLFLALSLKDHPKSKLWLTQAVKGLETCMNDQVYEDGVDFEGSIPYHRLVLELFAYSAITVIVNDVKFSKEYYVKLFKMFEFSAAYIDENGNAPQIGDNDSGRLFIFNVDLNDNPYSNEHDHSYLLSLGEHIFDHTFKSKCEKRDNVIKNFLPKINKLSLHQIDVVPRDTEKSISFENGGAYFLKNNKFDLCLSCFPTGQKGKGGHNHLDTGSFTLSINGDQVIVDPGTGTYTRDKTMRDVFRSYSYHNTLFTNEDDNINWNNHSYFGLGKYYEYKINKFSNEQLYLDIFFSKDKKKRTREFTIEENSFFLKDFYESLFYSRLNLNPDIKIVKYNNNRIETDKFIIFLRNAQGYEILDYNYSPFYDKIIPGKYLLISAYKFLEIEIRFNL